MFDSTYISVDGCKSKSPKQILQLRHAVWLNIIYLWQRHHAINIHQFRVALTPLAVAMQCLTWTLNKNQTDPPVKISSPPDPDA